MSHPIVHIEMSAKDRKGLSSFYSSNFGWEIRDYDEMNYTTFSWGEEGRGGGFMDVSEDNPPGTVIPYIHVDDIKAVLEKIEGSGGQTLMPPTAIPGVGLLAQFADPAGNRVALIQPTGETS